nr:MAG TPA: hypothetical protein [Caudoviricetes sp.]
MVYGYWLGVPTFHFYHIELHTQEYISEMKTWHKYSTTKNSLYYSNQQPTDKRLL